MRKRFLIVIILIAVLGFGSLASAAVSTPNIWKIVSNAISPVVANWELGSATNRIKKGWFTSLDATSATIGSIAVSGTVSGDMVVGGQVRASNGTSTAPSYSFNSDTNTGMLWGGNDIIKFNNNGTTTLTIAANGQPKLGFLASSTANLVMSDTLGNLYTSIDNRITSATSPLVLAANSLSINKASSTANGYLSSTDWTSFNGKVSSQWATSGSNVSYVAGSVGIGTTNPSSLLEIANSVDNNLTLYRTQNGVEYGVGTFFALNNSTNAKTVYSEVSGSIASNTAGSESGNLIFLTKNSGTLAEKMRINNLGNVGIGITNPSGKLMVAGFTYIAGDNSSNTRKISIIPSVAGNQSIYADYSGSGGDSKLILGSYANRANQLVLDTTGNVGIGLTNPSYKLDVSGSIHGTSYYSSDGTIGTSTTINVRKADDTGACTITVKNGLITTTTCP